MMVEGRGAEALSRTSACGRTSDVHARRARWAVRLASPLVESNTISSGRSMR